LRLSPAAEQIVALKFYSDRRNPAKAVGRISQNVNLVIVSCDDSNKRTKTALPMSALATEMYERYNAVGQRQRRHSF
jgi:hypothetical protein